MFLLGLKERKRQEVRIISAGCKQMDRRMGRRGGEGVVMMEEEMFMLVLLLEDSGVCFNQGV